MNSNLTFPTRAVAHLTPAVWAKVNRRLIAKAIGEFAHELLIEPRQTRTEGAWGHYVLDTEGPEIEYHFRARRFLLDHWAIDLPSLRKLERGQEAPLDALRLIGELRERLGIRSDVLPEYLAELSATLYVLAYKHERPGPRARDLALADFQVVEAAMSDGHPSFVANAGRVGFSAVD